MLGPVGRIASRYPSQQTLIAALADNEGVAESQLVLTNGSDELCYLIGTLFIESGEPVVLSRPCYQIEEIVTRVQLGEPRFVPLKDDGGHDLHGMAEAAQDAAVAWIPSPHNPTGRAVDLGELEWFLETVPDECLVVLDEAYRCFVESDERPECLRLVESHHNLLVQRTFSKSYGLAGLRLGYGIAAPELAETINTARAPFNVNAAALAAGRAALANPAWRDYAIALVRRERDRLHTTLSDLAMEHFRSQANFVTVRPPNVEALLEAFGRVGIAVRNGRDLGLPGWVRISIGAPTEMAMVRRVLRETA